MLVVGRQATFDYAYHANPHRAMRDGFALTTPKATGSRWEPVAFGADDGNRTRVVSLGS